MDGLQDYLNKKAGLKQSIISILGKAKSKMDFVFNFTSKNGKTISDSGISKCLETG